MGSIGAVVTIVGLIWTLQGLGVIPGSFMTGNRTWLYIGLVCLASGIFAVIIAVRPPTGRTRDTHT